MDSFVKRWVKLAEAQTNNVIKFFCLYIPFNYLYNARNGKYEHQRVANYIKGKGEIVFENSFPELKKDVSDSKTNTLKNYIIKEKNINCRLALNVYQVRCNLFHGSKFMNCDRDYKLIEESITFLSKILEVEND